jgi:RNase P/RNase MRP subunit p30
MSRPTTTRGRKIRAFADKWGLAESTARKMLMRSPQLVVLDDTTVAIFVNMSKQFGEPKEVIQ